MKKLFTSLFALAVMATASAQMTENAEARVYAYGLTQSGDNVVTVSFKTNTTANSAVVILSAEGQDDIEVEASSTDGKNWTAVIEPSQEFTANVDYNWSVKVSADPVTAWNMISDHNTPNFTYFRSFGVAVDNNPESDNFGRVYVTNSKSGTTGSGSMSRNTDVGFYTYNPDLTAQNEGKAYTCKLIGEGTNGNNTTIESASGDRPNNIVVGNDGNIYAAIRETSLSGVYRINPTDFSYKKIFVGTTDENGVITNENSEEVASIPNAMGVRGEGDDMQIFTINRNPDFRTSTSAYQVFRRYDIGTNETWSKKPSWSATMASKSDYHANNVQIISDICAIAPVSTGFWATQYRGSTSASQPSIFYANNDGKVIFSAEGSLESASVDTRNGAIAVHEELGLVAHLLRANARARVFKYSIDEDGVVTVDANDVKTYELTNLGTVANGLAFDYAGNLYANASTSTNKECLGVYALPTDDNTCTTPAKKSLTIAYTQGQIEATGVEEIGVENAPVEYYNLQGMKVENPSNGVFIKKQGGKAVKVVL